MKKRNIKKFGILFLIIFFLWCGLVVSNKFLKMKTSNIVVSEALSMNSKKEKVYTEKKLEEFTNQIYVTLLSKDSKVISTTNPNTKVDEMYKFTEESYPRKRVKIDDSLFVLFEISGLEDEEGHALLDEDSVYYMNIPSYIIPDKDIVNEKDNEIEFYNTGNIKAYGGVYKEGETGYRFKVRFENLENKIDSKATYQFSFKLSKNIKKQVTDLKTISFENIGNLQFWLEPETIITPQPETYPYELKESGTFNNSNNATFTTTITDKRDYSDRAIKGKLSINLSNGIGLEVDRYNFFTDVEIYADGTKLSSSSSGTWQNSYYLNGKRIIDLTVNSFGPSLENDSGTYQCTNDVYHYSCIVSSIDLNFGGYYNEEIRNVKEWKVVIKESLYTINSGYYSNQVVFSDYMETNQLLNTSYSIYKWSTSPYISASTNEIDGYNNTTSKKRYSLERRNNPSNYFEMEFDSDYENNSGLNYYMNSNAFSSYSNGGNLSDTMNVYINGSLINFVSGGFYAKSLASGQVQSANPTLQKQMKEVFGADYDFYSKGYPVDSRYPQNYYQFFRSTSTNENGKYYWLVFSKNTVLTGYNNYNGRGDYANYEQLASNKIAEAPSWKVYMFNVSDKNVRFEVDYTIGNVVRKYDITSGGGADYSEVTIKNNCGSDRSNPGYGFSYDRYMVINGERLNDNAIKWNVEIDVTELNEWKEKSNWV